MGVVKEEKGGRAAQTDWRVLAQDHSLALLALTLQTGRTHQIRVHLSSIGRPVLGDAEYGWTKPRTLQAMPQSFRPALASVWPARQMLHAARLTLEHPIAGDLRIDVHSRPPDDMARVLNAAFGNAWRPAVDDWFTEPVDAHGRSGLNGHDSQDDEEGPALQEPLDAD
jgi:23S rRNA pseudouridine1911/1915/1917 synthase